LTKDDGSPFSCRVAKTSYIFSTFSLRFHIKYMCDTLCFASFYFTFIVVERFIYPEIVAWETRK